MNNNNPYDTDTARAEYIAYVIATCDVLLRPQTAVVHELMLEQGMTEDEVFECLHEDIVDRYAAILESTGTNEVFKKYFARIRTLIAAYVRHEGISFEELCPEWDSSDPMARTEHNRIQLLKLGFDAQLRLIEQ